MKISEAKNIQSTSIASKINPSCSSVTKDGKVLEDKQAGVFTHNSQGSTKEEVKNSLEQLNDAVQAIHKDLKFELHDESQRMMVKVMDLDKHKVIKELPPEEVLDMVGRIKEMVGLILDQKI